MPSDTMFFIGILGLITGILILKYVQGFIKARKYSKPRMSHLHQEVRDLMQATQQIKKEWSEVIGIVNQVRARQSHFVANVQTLTKNLCEGPRRLEQGDPKEKDLKLREEARLYVDTVDALAAKLANMRQEAMKQAEALVEELAKVEDSADVEDSKGMEVMTVVDEEPVKDAIAVVKKVTTVADDKPVKDAIAVVKKVLKDFLKENRKNMNSEKEDMKKNVRGLTDGLKEAIASSIIAVVTSQSDQQTTITTTITEKPKSTRELSTKMLGVIKSLKTPTIDVSSTKGILDTIDGQLDEIYCRLELDTKAMNKQCQESSVKMATIGENVDKQAGLLDETGAALAKVIAGMSPCDEEDEDVKKKVEEVSEMLHQFTIRVEVPIKMLVSNMRFLYESTVCRASKGERNYERGDIPDEDAQEEEIAEENVLSLIKDFEMRNRNRKVLPRPTLALDYLHRQAPQSMR